MNLVPIDALRALPGDPTGVLCAYCFEEVYRHEKNGGNLLSCGCYGRFYEPGNDRHKEIAQERWKSFIDASADWRLNAEIASAPIVNPSPLGAWCPVCERDRQIASTGIWLSRKKLVAKYGTCKACSRRYKNASDQAREEIHKRCEVSLLRRYPFLQERLGAQGDNP
jgi:hypothetical protein